MLVVALEKRFCFTLRDMDSRAAAFEHFLSLIDVEPALGTSPDQDGSRRAFIGRRIDPGQIPQRLQGYDRGPDLELWELRLK